VESDINDDLSEIPVGHTKIKRITYRVFCRIILLYFKYHFIQMIDHGRSAIMLNKFGTLKIVKTLCTRYNPTKWIFKTVNGKVVREKVKIDINSLGGYFYFPFWESDKKYRQYRFYFTKPWKRRLWAKAKEGMDYFDYTLTKTGRNASPDYIQKIK